MLTAGSTGQWSPARAGRVKRTFISSKGRNGNVRSRDLSYLPFRLLNLTRYLTRLPTGGGQETKVAPLSHVVALKSRAEVSFRELIGDETDLRIQPCNRELDSAASVKTLDLYLTR